MGRCWIALLIGAPLLAQFEDKERALGRQMADEVRTRTIAAPSLTAYVRQVGARLENGAAFSFEAIVEARDFRSHEPIALPGGFVFVSAPLLANASSEREFARLLAHSMAHVIARHGVRIASRGELVNYGSVPLIYSGAPMSDRTPIGMQAAWRQFEADADAIAADLLARSDFDRSPASEEFAAAQAEARRLLQAPPSKAPSLRRP